MSNFQPRIKMSKEILYITSQTSPHDETCLLLDNARLPYKVVAPVNITNTQYSHYSTVLLNIHSDGVDISLVQYLLKQYQINLFIVAKALDTNKAVQLVKQGVIDIFIIPNDNTRLIDTLNKPSQHNNDIVIQDKNSIVSFELAKKVCHADASVLILGESGVGKEVLAKYIHTHSNRHNKPFVAINCAAIPENMLEGLLFGHEKGAFTGAIQSSPGKFEQANGGTLLLDEISEMPLSLQAKLLRVLQEKEVERLGAKKSIPLDVRVLATSNQNLKEQVKKGLFREDLFFRLNVFPITIAPLRQRVEDILPLANYFIKKYTSNASNFNLSDNALDKIQRHQWPGNIRELSNVIQRACILANNQIQAEDIVFDDIEQPSDNGQASSLYDHLKHNESEIIIQVLKDNNGNRKLTAQQLGISPRTLRYKISNMKSQGVLIPSRQS